MSRYRNILLGAGIIILLCTGTALLFKQIPGPFHPQPGTLQSGKPQTGPQPAGTTEAAPPKGQTTAQTSPGDRGRNEPTAANKAGPPQTAGTGSQQELEDFYLARLQSIAGGYRDRLNSLVDTARTECIAARKQNPRADLTPIINRYYAAGKALEAQCDGEFYATLAEFKNKLRADGYPLNAANRAAQTYAATKSAWAGNLLALRSRL